MPQENVATICIRSQISLAFWLKTSLKQFIFVRIHLLFFFFIWMRLSTFFFSFFFCTSSPSSLTGVNTLERHKRRNKENSPYCFGPKQWGVQKTTPRSPSLKSRPAPCMRCWRSRRHSGVWIWRLGWDSTRRKSAQKAASIPCEKWKGGGRGRSNAKVFPLWWENIPVWGWSEATTGNNIWSVMLVHQGRTRGADCLKLSRILCIVSKKVLERPTQNTDEFRKCRAQCPSVV